MFFILLRPALTESIGLSWWLSGNESAYQCRRCEFDPWVDLATKQQQPTTESTTEIKDFTPVAQIKRIGEKMNAFLTQMFTNETIKNKSDLKYGDTEIMAILLSE